MKRKTQKALVIEQYGGKILIKDVPMPEIKEGEVLIKVQASTINPSDKLLMDGACFERPLPSICGIQGTGRVIDAKGELATLWIGTRVCFISPAYGSWVQYSVSTPFQIFEIEQDTPLQSAACGLVNPLTALGFVERYRALGCKYGMINTAAASALGRMLIRLCKKQKIPLLNIVHRQQQKQMLESEGADYVIVTKGQWEAEYREFIFKNKFDCLFDALGGGAVTQKLISNLLPGARVLAYGALQGKPLVINSVIQLLKGLTVEGFLIFSWWGRCSPQLQESIRQNLSEYLIGDLSTKLLKQVSMEQIDEGLMLSYKRASEGKVILRISKDV